MGTKMILEEFILHNISYVRESLDDALISKEEGKEISAWFLIGEVSAQLRLLKEHIIRHQIERDGEEDDD